MSKNPAATFEVACPCCQAKLTLDRHLGAVLSHIPPPKAPPSVDLDDTARLLRQQEEAVEAKFRASVEAEKTNGRVALVPGGARSLGKADATTLAAEGCRVAILDLNAEGAAETAKEIESAGSTAYGYACDIRDAAQGRETVRRGEAHLAPVDICVNNAGIIYTMGQLKDMNDADWELNLAVNL